MCGQCGRREQYQPSKWFQHIYDLYLWQLGGYWFGNNTLTPAEWVGLGLLKKALERR